VQWDEPWADECGITGYTTITRVAHSQQELDELLRRQQAAARRPSAGAFNPQNCYAGIWVPYRRRYARVIVPPKKCVGHGCIHVHTPRPLWVRVGNKVGFVPRHPNDVHGKPPLNLKNGIFFPPAKSGAPIQRMAWNSSEQVKLLDKPPAEFQRPAIFRGTSVAAPEIRAHLVVEPVRSGLVLGHPVDARITYNYRTREFMASGKPGKDGTSHPVAIGGIHANGRVSSFADGRSYSYASAFFDRSGVASSYRGGSYGYATNGAGSGGGYSHSGGGGSSSGGGHSSGGFSGSGSTGGSGASAGSGGGNHPR